MLGGRLGQLEHSRALVANVAAKEGGHKSRGGCDCLASFEFFMQCKSACCAETLLEK